MRQKLVTFSVFLLSFLLAIPAFGTSSDHLQTLRSKYPYGLLSDDFGILTLNDLALNACYFKPEPFPPVDFTSTYEYWQCFESRTISLSCDSNGVPDEHEGIMGLVVVDAFTDGVKHEYIERRPWKIRDCKDTLKNIATLTKGTSHVCISGSFIETETDKAGKKTASWLFDRFKTRKGCEGRNAI
jgi:hypothetical protein